MKFTKSMSARQWAKEFKRRLSELLSWVVCKCWACGKVDGVPWFDDMGDHEDCLPF